MFLSAGEISSPLSGPGRSCLFLTAASNTSSFVLLYCWGISIASASLPSDNLGEASFLQQGQPPQQLHCSAWAPVAGVSRSPHCPLVASSRPAGYVTWSLSAKGRANMVWVTSEVITLTSADECILSRFPSCYIKFWVNGVSLNSEFIYSGWEMSLLHQVCCRAIDSKLLRFSYPTRLTFWPRPASEGSENKERNPEN